MGTEIDEIVKDYIQSTRDNRISWQGKFEDLGKRLTEVEKRLDIQAGIRQAQKEKANTNFNRLRGWIAILIAIIALGWEVLVQMVKGH